MKKYSTPIADMFIQSSEEIMADVITTSGNIPTMSWDDFVAKSDVLDESGL